MNYEKNQETKKQLAAETKTTINIATTLDDYIELGIGSRFGFLEAVSQTLSGKHQKFSREVDRQVMRLAALKPIFGELADNGPPSLAEIAMQPVTSTGLAGIARHDTDEGGAVFHKPVIDLTQDDMATISSLRPEDTRMMVEIAVLKALAEQTDNFRTLVTDNSADITELQRLGRPAAMRPGNVPQS